MLERAEAILRHVRKQDKLLLALSGGADSFSALKWLSSHREFQGRIVACHVNHKLRPDAREVEELARRQAETLNVPFTFVAVDVREELRRRSQSVESCARRLRYTALEEARTSHSCRYIVTAHTLDDDAETVLMKLNLGSSWYECTGIPEKRENILRPFLRIRRSELLTLLSTGDLVDLDPMNREVRFKRVATRNQLCQVAVTLPKLANQLSNHGEAIQRVISLTSRLLKNRKINYIDDNFSDPGCLESLSKNLYLEDLDFLPVETAWATLCGTPNARFKAPLRRQVSKFIRSRKDLSRLPLPQRIYLVRTGKHIWLQASDVETTSSSQQPHKLILTPGAFRDSYAGQLSLSLERDAVLVARQWQEGEKFKPQARRTRNISDWLSEAGVHPGIRRRWPVICSGDRIIAIPGLGVCESVAPRPGFPILNIHWKAASLSDK